MSNTAQLEEQEVISKKKEDVPTMYLEVLAIGQSGYVLDGTKGTPHEEVINCAEVTFIPSRGKMAAPILKEDGTPTGRYKNVAIRYIKDCNEILVSEQKRLGIEPSTIANTDTIVIKKGKCLVKDEGDQALYGYLKNVFYNLSAPNRPRTAKAIYRVVEIEKGVSILNETRFLQAKAISLVETLVLKTGNNYKYKENKIDNILTALNLFGGDDYSTKIRVLTDHAEKHPKDFLDIVSKMDNITITEIMHSLELDVLRFEGNTLEYVEDKKVVLTVGSEFKSQAKKVEAASELLKTPEYSQAYTELKAKLEIAQEKSLK